MDSTLAAKIRHNEQQRLQMDAVAKLDAVKSSIYRKLTELRGKHRNTTLVQKILTEIEESLQ